MRIVRAFRREGDESPGVLHQQPAVINGELYTGAVFGRAGAIAEQKRPVDFLRLEFARQLLRSRGCAACREQN